MKKLIAIAVLACMILTFAGCGQDNNAKEESKGTVSIAESSAEESEEKSAEESSKTEESSKQESSKEEASEKKEESEQEKSAEESSEKAESDNAQAEKEAAEKAAAEKAAAEKAAAEKAAAEKAAAEKAAAEQAAAEKAAAEKAAAEKAAAEKAAAEQAAAEKAAAEKAAAEKAAQEQAAQQQSTNGSFSSSDLAMSYNGRTVTLLTPISNAVSSIGKALSTEKLPSCLSLDAPDDVIYTYNGFTLQTLTDSSGEKVYNIDITGSGAATAKGIAVGSSSADIEKAYGKAAEADDFLMRYTVDGGKNTLDFMIENGKVTEIIIAYAP